MIKLRKKRFIFRILQGFSDTGQSFQSESSEPDLGVLERDPDFERDVEREREPDFDLERDDREEREERDDRRARFGTGSGPRFRPRI